MDAKTTKTTPDFSSLPLSVTPGKWGAWIIEIKELSGASDLLTTWEAVAAQAQAAVYVQGIDDYFGTAHKHTLRDLGAQLLEVNRHTNLRTHYKWFGATSDKVPEPAHVTTGVHCVLYDGKISALQYFACDILEIASVLAPVLT